MMRKAHECSEEVRGSTNAADPEASMRGRTRLCASSKIMTESSHGTLRPEPGTTHPRRAYQSRVVISKTEKAAKQRRLQSRRTNAKTTKKRISTAYTTKGFRQQTLPRGGVNHVVVRHENDVGFFKDFFVSRQVVRANLEAGWK